MSKEELERKIEELEQHITALYQYIDNLEKTSGTKTEALLGVQKKITDLEGDRDKYKTQLKKITDGVNGHHSPY